ncbi:MAG: TonB-dependent receptor [candidate division WOR-3 bacterium]
MASAGFLLLFGLIVAQPSGVTITGRVLDEADAPVEFANVALYRLPDSSLVTGTVTDRNGSFRLADVQPGRYYLEISFIGFGTRRVEEIECAAGARIDLGRLTIQPKPLPVRGAEVVGERPALSYRLDRKVIDVTRLPNAASGTAVDALQNVPGVKVDIEGNVTLRGSANFQVLFDGRPSPLPANEALKQTPAATIEKIEVITNPSARYDPEGTAGIINIILKKERGRGVSALVNANAGLRNRYGADGLFSLRRGRVSGFAGGNFGHRLLGYQGESETRTFGAQETLKITTSSTGQLGSTFASARAGLELGILPMDITTISARLGRFQGENSDSSLVTESRLPLGTVQQFNEGGGWNSDIKFLFLLMDHEHRFDTAGQKLVGRCYLIGRDGQVAWNQGRRDSLDTVLSGRRSSESGPMKRINLELEYNLPLRGGNRLEAGLESHYGYTDQDYRLYRRTPATSRYELDTLASHPYRFTGRVNSGYATYSTRWKELAIQPGLRLEQFLRRTQVMDTALSWQTGALDIFPSLHLSYTLPGDHKVKASYSRRIDKPDPWFLRPFPEWRDEHNISQGNPQLRPAYVNSWEAGYELPFGANQITLEAYLRTTSDMFEWVTTRYSQDTTVLLQTAANIGQDRSLGLELSANLSPFRWLTLYLTADIYNYHEWGSLFGQEIDRRTFTGSGSCNLSLQFPSATQVQFNTTLSGPSVTATGTSATRFTADLALRQSLFNRALSITLRCSNLFGPGIWRNQSEGLGFLSRSTYTGEGRTLSLALSYNLNNFRFDPKMRAGEELEQEGTGMPRR